MRQYRFGFYLFGAIGALLFPALVPETAQGRLDPLRIIYTQAREKPAVYIMLDVSGSMEWPAITSGCRLCRSPGCSAVCRLESPVGRFYVAIREDFTRRTNRRPPDGTGHGYWVRIRRQGDAYSYWFFVPPSRMAMAKNLLGDCFTIYDVAPDLKNAPRCRGNITPCRGGTGLDPDLNWRTTYYRFRYNDGPTQGAFYSIQLRSNGQIRSEGWVGYTGSMNEPVPDLRYTVARPPVNFVENNIDNVYWGLGFFSTRFGGFYATRQTPIVPSDDNNNATVTSIKNAMRPARGGGTGTCAGTGIRAGGGTPASAGLNFVKRELDQFWGQDDRAHQCTRPYYTIFVTDGQSNRCNPNGSQWGNSCPGYTDPSTLRDFPPGRTDELFLMQRDNFSECANRCNRCRTTIPVQTFVIGISPQVSRCELNLNAFCGRTDASADDAGVDWQNNPRAPQNSNQSCANQLAYYRAPPACDPSSDPDCKDYAFFANNPQQLEDAFKKILAGILKGDYSTSTPTATLTTGVTAAQEALLMPSTKIPGWKGSLRKWDVIECGDTGVTHVDVSTVKFEEVCERIRNGEIISSGDPQCNAQEIPHFHLKWDAACSLLDQADPARDDYGRNIYTVNANCGLAYPAGPSAACREIHKIRKDNATILFFRNKITTVDWTTVDFDGDGIAASADDDDMLMLIDFILGGDGQGNKRDWLLGDIIGNSPITISLPFHYGLGTVPNKLDFDEQVRNREPIAYTGANDGLLHAFYLNHDPTTGNPPIEVFAFLPPQHMPEVIQMFQNYRNNPKIPTGQAEVPDFDDHIWTLSAPLNYADVWLNYENVYATVLYVPLGYERSGLYALDVTDPATALQNNEPPFRVLWFWQTSDPTIGTKVLAAVPLTPSFADPPPKVNGRYTQWIVGIVTTEPDDNDTTSLLTLVAADTGQPMSPTTTRKESGTGIPGMLVPFKFWSHMAFQSRDVTLPKPDMLSTHMFVVDTAGRLHIWNIYSEDVLDWTVNSPYPFDSAHWKPWNPLYYTPAMIRIVLQPVYLLATITGSFFETDPDINNLNSTKFCTGQNYCPLITLDLAPIDDATNNVTMPETTDTHFELRPVGTFEVRPTVDTDNDGRPDKCVDLDGDGNLEDPPCLINLSPHTRAVGRPVIAIEKDIRAGIVIAKPLGKALFVVFDPQFFNPAAQACTGRSFLLPVYFEFSETQGAPGGVGFSNITVGQLSPLGYGAVTGVTAVAGYVVVSTTGYGPGIAFPEFTEEKVDNPNPTFPLLRGVRRVE